MHRSLHRGLPLLAALALATPAAAQLPRVQTAEEALVQDAGEYARLVGVTPDEAARRLAVQRASADATDRIRRAYRDRLAGIAIEHRPEHRIVVLLSGDDLVPDETVAAGGTTLPITFRTGARATAEQVRAALRTHGDTIRALVPASEGMGLDQRTGELVVLVQALPADPLTIDALLETITRVPVRLRVLPGDDANMTDVAGGADVAGGSRVEGVDPASGRRHRCTTGFVVTDGARTGLVTAAHCPDELTLLGPDGAATPLAFLGGWGAWTQDVQVHVGTGAPPPPHFYADAGRRVARPLTAAAPRAAIRAGDPVCHRGEASGYSCAPVELTDYAPPGDLCGGPCAPTWVTVAGPQCRGGDSGGPVFAGTVALGIAKGGNWSRGGRCNFYYYMSLDYLPIGWRAAMAEGTAEGAAEGMGRSAPPVEQPDEREQQQPGGEAEHEAEARLPQQRADHQPADDAEREQRPAGDAAAPR